MPRKLQTILLFTLLGVAAGAGDVSPPDVIAQLNGINITRQQITEPLIEGYGLNVLINTMQLELAKQYAVQHGIAVTPQDITTEHDLTLARLFKDAAKEDYPQLLDQFFQQQRISRPEFEILIQTNAYLRKIVEPIVKDGLTEDRLHESFNALYGETVQVRHIQCANTQEISEAKRRLAAGQPFEKVARELSRNGRTAPLGGEMPPFSRFADYPEVFKDVAFSLKPGEVSDTVETGGVYHIIQLEKRFPPKAVNYEDVKQSLKDDLSERLTQAKVKELRATLMAQIAKSMTVSDPVLARQYEAKKTQADASVHGKKEALDAIRRDGSRAADAAAESPAGEGLRPPATMPGSAPGVSDMPMTSQPTTTPTTQP